METIVQDLRYGIRQLVKNPGFTAIAIFTLALGIGINATMFSLVSAILLRRPPGREPDRVAVISGVDPGNGYQPDTATVSIPNYLSWREANHVFSEMGAADEYHSASLTGQQESEFLHTAAVSANYFDVLGVTADLGRTFSAGEDQSGQEHVAILSHDLWERRFGSDPSIVGRTIRLNRENYNVIGVMPASFHMLGFPPELWTPLVVGRRAQGSPVIPVRANEAWRDGRAGPRRVRRTGSPGRARFPRIRKRLGRNGAHSSRFPGVRFRHS